MHAYTYATPARSLSKIIGDNQFVAQVLCALTRGLLGITRRLPSVLSRTIVSGNYHVRRLDSLEEVRDLVMERMRVEGWKPGALDHISYFAADSTGYFVGELYGKPISCFSAVKFGNYFAFLGSYVVDKAHQGKGYGLELFNAGYHSVKDRNVGGDAVMENVNMYGTVGLKTYWDEYSYELAACHFVKGEEVNMVTSSQHIFPHLLEYHTRVHGFDRHLFLEKWAFAPNCICSIAVDDIGKIQGYGVIRTVPGMEAEWRIGPLFAANSIIARNILNDLCYKVSLDRPEAVVTVTVPHGSRFCEETLKIMEERNATIKATFARVYSKGIPENMQLTKMFALTTLELG